VPLPPGYDLVLPAAGDVPRLVRALHDWFPGLAVGNASCFLREDFYTERVCLAGGSDRDGFVLLYRRGNEWAGMLAVERDRDSQVVYGRVGTVAGPHRGAGLSRSFPPLMEAMGRAMGMGMAYSLCTLKAPQMQRCFERSAWQLVGIMPGFDREVVEPGVVMRVFEAIYVKVLATQTELFHPGAQGMTEATRSLYELLYARGRRPPPRPDAGRC
jgi:hypothetical protein